MGSAATGSTSQTDPSTARACEAQRSVSSITQPKPPANSSQIRCSGTASIVAAMSDPRARPLLEAPLIIVLLGWLAALGIVVYGVIKLLGLAAVLVARRRGEPAAGARPPA